MSSGSQSAPWSDRQLHFIGIGGAGMSGLALVAKQLGASVTGSDRDLASNYLKPLVELGVSISDHDPSLVNRGQEVVYSTAISSSHPEIVRARECEIPLLHRAELLAELTEIKPTVAISGTHGKSTTSSMLVHALVECGADPSFLVGAEIPSLQTNARWSDGTLLVVEADESDRSLLKLHADIAVVTNAEWDHHSTYSSIQDVKNTFRQFLEPAKVRIVGRSPELEDISRGLETVEFSLDRFEPTPQGCRFRIDDQVVELPVPGLHNAQNAAAALSVCKAVGLEVGNAAEALSTFSGAKRRFQQLGRTTSGALIVDDYAHHPTEVRAALEAARPRVENRLIAVFQPHLFSRTQREANAFGKALSAADEIVVTEIFPAREKSEDFPGVSGRDVARAAADAGRGKRVVWLPQAFALRGWLTDNLAEGDLCLLMGAGDIDKVAHGLVSEWTTMSAVSERENVVR